VWRCLGPQSRATALGLSCLPICTCPPRLSWQMPRQWAPPVFCLLCPGLHEQGPSPGSCRWLSGCRWRGQDPSTGPARARATPALTCAGEKLIACLMAVSHCQGHRIPSPLSQRKGKNQRIDLKEEVLRVPAELAVPSAGPRTQVTLQWALPKAPAQPGISLRRRGPDPQRTGKTLRKSTLWGIKQPCPP